MEVSTWTNKNNRATPNIIRNTIRTIRRRRTRTIPTRVSMVIPMTRRILRNKTPIRVSLSTSGKVCPSLPSSRRGREGSIPSKPQFSFPSPFPNPVHLRSAFHLFRNLVRSNPPPKLVPIFRADCLSLHKRGKRVRLLERVALRNHR